MLFVYTHARTTPNIWNFWPIAAEWQNGIAQRIQTTYAAVLLTIPPNLKELSFRVSVTESEYAPAGSPFYWMFNQDWVDFKAFVQLLSPFFSRLRNVKSLSIHGGNSDILYLPFQNLKSIDVDLMHNEDGSWENWDHFYGNDDFHLTCGSVSTLTIRVTGKNLGLRLEV
jgi:hypothetical protein